MAVSLEKVYVGLQISVKISAAEVNLALVIDRRARFSPDAKGTEISTRGDRCCGKNVKLNVQRGITADGQRQM